MVRTRFAPSPTGYMHIGNLRTALYEFLIAKSAGGSFILRIEDTDQERFVEGATDIIYKTLEMSGITHDEGPDVGGEYGPYIQSERKNDYIKYAKELIEKGEAYYCFCTKERLDSLKTNTGHEILFIMTDIVLTFQKKKLKKTLKMVYLTLLDRKLRKVKLLSTMKYTVQSLLITLKWKTRF